MMGTHNPDLLNGLESQFDCVNIDWTEYTNKYNQLQSDILSLYKKHNPDIVFIHVQSDGIIGVDTAKIMSEKSLVFNWTGDVRQPLPDFYTKLGRHITSTLFTNMNDVNYLRNNGIKSDYLQVGFDSKKFNPLGKTDGKYPEIIFLGSNYVDVFPLSKYRYEMVHTLKNHFGSKFGVYGSGWGDISNGYIDNYDDEGTAYRSCKIAINLSHFAYSRYSSDRMYRILGSGAFCLTHHFPDIELDLKTNKDLVVWHNINDLVNKINKYLVMDKERETIALNGCFNVRTSHTWHHFAKNLNEIANKYDKERLLDTANKA